MTGLNAKAEAVQTDNDSTVPCNRRPVRHDHKPTTPLPF